ncbi:substrate-binding domain-containing protein [Halomonas daqingensis]|uniref:Substrate-binding domain-containing protein n=1 Tax=Billgrantia desiderata TaxID=52021 RepID=A0ABS9BA26_9GAMM|nr:substrate-binding domain-containing protein [Halomonas desiderata]MCE8044184.1 substrate-binding domain-containing protein [Halomonas desiderata]MCE8048758.1 substrate-binding domain-containing protein [Halomonas desiderata]
MPRRATIIEVALEAGASKTSVSRYFAGERDKLSPALCERIAAAALRLDYRPNQMARGLKAGRSRLIGMLVADIRNPFSVAVLHGVERACREQGLSLLVCNTDNDPELERTHLALMSSYQVEGLIINASGSPDTELQALTGQGLPLVLLDRELGAVQADLVGLDNAKAIDLALDHLAEQGYAELLYLSEPPERASPRRERLAHFQAGLATRRLAGEAYTMSGSDEELQRAIEAFLTRSVPKGSGDLPRALLCANGAVTLAATRALQRLGARLGKTGLMGIDELDWCALIAPGITTLAQPTEAIGRQAVASLLANSVSQAAAEPRQHRFEPRLIARGSTRLTG